MEPDSLPNGFPVNQADWERLIAAAPGEDRPLTAEEDRAWETAELFPGGGVEDFVNQRAEKVLAEAAHGQ